MDYESGIGLSDHVKIEVMKGEQNSLFKSSELLIIELYSMINLA